MKKSLKIDDLMLENQIKNKLRNKKILFLKDLSSLKKRDLMKMDFSLYEIEQIEIKLQLEGFDLKR